MKLSMLGFLEVVEAHGIEAVDRLRQAGYLEKIIVAKAEKAARRHYVDYGVVAYRCWLTPSGRTFLATHRSAPKGAERAMSTEMRVLTVRQPWAWAIIHGGKTVENRTRNIAGSYRGPVAIHVAQAEDVNAFSLSPCPDALNAAAGLQTASADWWNNHGHIIGVVDLVDVHEPHDGMRATGRGEAGGKSWGTWGSCSKWAERDAWHLVLANPRPLSGPIPYRGGLGLRRLPADVVDLVKAGLK